MSAQHTPAQVGCCMSDALGRYGRPNCFGEGLSPVARAIDQMERGLASEAGRVAVNAETQAARDSRTAERAFGKPGVTK